jgi:hypothetical protein
MTSTTKTCQPMDGVCRPLNPEAGWHGTEFPTVTGAFAKILFHPEGGIVFESEDAMHCVDATSGRWHRDLKLEVVKPMGRWSPEGEDGSDTQPESVCITWSGNQVLQDLSRETAQEVMTLLRYQVLKHHKKAEPGLKLREKIMIPICFAVTAVLLGGSAGLVCATVLSRI